MKIVKYYTNEIGNLYLAVPPATDGIKRLGVYEITISGSKFNFNVKIKQVNL